MSNSTFQRVAFQLEISFIAPIISQVSGAVRHGLDAASLRDRDGNPALPGSLIQGNLKHHWKSLNEHTDCPSNRFIQKYLPNTPNDHDYTPNRGELTFSDFWSAKIETPGHHLHHRIKIDEKSGKTQHGALQIIESLYAPGEEVTFCGTITAWLPNDTAIQEMKTAIYKGMTFMPAAGAFKGIGFGRVETVKVTAHTLTPRLIKDDFNGQGDLLGMIIEPEHAICFSRHLIGNNSRINSSDGNKSGLDNSFVSEDFISGGAIKGSIATFLQKQSGNNDFPLLTQHLDKIRFTHAQPALKGRLQRGSPLPISIVSIKDKDKSTDRPDNEERFLFYDIANKSGAGLIYDKAPAFATDWKEEMFEKAAAIEALNMPTLPERSISIHTAINMDTGASDDHQLFSIESLKPDKIHWLSNITLPQMNDETNRQKLLQELKTLFALGLHWLGKTNASAKVGITTPFLTTHQKPDGFNNINMDDTLTITLLSDARLLQPGENIPATNGGKQLRGCYRQNWRNLSGGGLELSHFYAEQKLVGGRYLHKRFNKPAKAPYNPQIFTKAGSVFIFKVTDVEKAQNSINQWLRDGLPQLSGVSSRWQDNPYIAANGYGEIAVNLALATEPDQAKESNGVKEWEPIEEVKA